uniref:Anion exchange protein n=1 Tax=Acrobeloides nanus TaxID=290746 RepID=A0A914DPB5_9BILA
MDGNHQSDELDVLQELLSQPRTPTNPIANQECRFSLVSTTSAMSESSEPTNKAQGEKNFGPPPEVLVELYDLKLNNEENVEGVWEETARWIKYEEDVEGIDHRWGAPHVAFLSFHALIQLRKCMAKGVILLDCNAENFHEVCETIAAAMASEGHDVINTKKIIQVLELKHNIAPSKMSRISTAASALFNYSVEASHETRTKSEPRKSLTSAGPIHKRERVSTERSHMYASHPMSQPTIVEVDENSEVYNSIQKDENPMRQQKSAKRGSRASALSSYKEDVVLKQLPEGTETAQVFVGELESLKRARFVMVRLAQPTLMPEIIERQLPVRFIFLILGPHLRDGNYHELGRSMATLMSNKQFKSIAYGAKDKSQLVEGVDQFIDEAIVIPPGEVDSKRLLSGDEIKKALKRRRNEVAMNKKEQEKTPPERRQSISNGSAGNSLKSKKKCIVFDGMLKDLSNRYKQYGSDFRDALNFQCLTSIVFMFFASFAPAITFGGLMGKYTKESMGTIETLIAQSICGIIWGLFAAQPLLIMSPTGPVLIFEYSLYAFCESYDLDFLTIRFFAGIWIFMISVIMVAVDGSRLLVFVTRFTEDIFACLISMIFISESLKFIIQTWNENPVENYAYYIQNEHGPKADSCNKTSPGEKGHPCHEPNTALLTAIVLFSTFFLALMLKKLRESFYLGRHLRSAIGDFGVLISIVVVYLFVTYITPEPALQKLEMPSDLDYTNHAQRKHNLFVEPWMFMSTVNPIGISISLAAALLVFILLFVETEITELLLSRKERGLKKGTGMHWDLLLMGICSLICSIFGLPWMCAAAVQSLAHCSSLTVMKKGVPGARPEVDKVIEQRVTTIGVSILMGLVAFCGEYLKLPIAALFGVFLYLGVMNLYGVQLVQRFILFFVPEKYFPKTPYTENVTLWKIHIYTVIQIVFLAGVYAVKHFPSSALAFPFVLMMFIVFRQLILPFFFNDFEIKALDGEEETDDEDWMDKDFYENAPIPV